MNKTYITRGLVALVLLAVVFSVGLFFGRTVGLGGFTVTTEYQMGAVSVEELDDLAQQMEQAEARQTPPSALEQVQTAPIEEAPAPDSGLVNINTADHTALQVLPGVGPAIAQRIIDHREAHGPFQIIEEITDVSGIGPARFADIRDLITVE
ncbi:MAG: ComEA family DNA-binding protein [Oscillospiraceae bacterium]|nr:ComEA family DNA-binding protein [Oscillospiraceae bacterium]